MIPFKCFMCGLDVQPFDVKYHTADRTKVFCGAQCSHTYFLELKEKENEDGE